MRIWWLVNSDDFVNDIALSKLSEFTNAHVRKSQILLSNVMAAGAVKKIYKTHRLSVSPIGQLCLLHYRRAHHDVFSKEQKEIDFEECWQVNNTHHDVLSKEQKKIDFEEGWEVNNT
jgi:hypothetical protein